MSEVIVFETMFEAWFAIKVKIKKVPRLAAQLSCDTLMCSLTYSKRKGIINIESSIIILESSIHAFQRT